MFKSVRDYENFHILLWLIKDTCWLMEYRLMGLMIIIPTVGFAFFITWKNRAVLSELIHNGAVCFWICANSTWMIGEFFLNDTTRPIALALFTLGLLLILGFHGHNWLMQRQAKSNP